jgi:hypothetical protein
MCFILSPVTVMLFSSFGFHVSLSPRWITTIRYNDHISNVRQTGGSEVILNQVTDFLDLGPSEASSYCSSQGIVGIVRPEVSSPRSEPPQLVPSKQNELVPQPCPAYLTPSFLCLQDLIAVDWLQVLTNSLQLSTTRKATRCVATP